MLITKAGIGISAESVIFSLDRSFLQRPNRCFHLDKAIHVSEQLEHEGIFMPIPPRPLTFICPGCAWQKTTIPQSDALFIGRDFYGQCPKCKYEPLEGRLATRTEILKARLEDLF